VKNEVLQSQEGKEYSTYNKKEGTLKWIGHILRSNCLLKHVNERKTEGKICGGRRGRIRKQLMEDLKEMTEYCKLKKATLDRTLVEAMHLS